MEDQEHQHRAGELGHAEEDVVAEAELGESGAVREEGAGTGRPT